MYMDVITLLALLWVPTSFIFAETDRQVNELMNRLRIVLANFNGITNLDQLTINNSMSPTELFDYSIAFNKPEKLKKANLCKNTYKIVAYTKFSLAIYLIVLILSSLLKMILKIEIIPGNQNIIPILCTLYLVLLSLFYLLSSFLVSIKLVEFTTPKLQKK